MSHSDPLPRLTGRLGAGAGSDPVDQCRSLAVLLHERQAKRGLRSIVVTAAVETDGKTRFALDLATALASVSGKRVLLIDGELRAPFVHELIGVSHATGLSDVLEDEPRDVPLAQVSPLLHVLSVGSAIFDVTLGAASGRTRALIEECAGRYPWVVLNAPPMSLLGHSQALGWLGQGVAFVIGASSPFQIAEQAMTAIGRERIEVTALIGFHEPSQSRPATTIERAAPPVRKVR